MSRMMRAGLRRLPTIVMIVPPLALLVESAPRMAGFVVYSVTVIYSGTLYGPGVIVGLTTPQPWNGPYMFDPRWWQFVWEALVWAGWIYMPPVAEMVMGPWPFIALLAWVGAYLLARLIKYRALAE